MSYRGKRDIVARIEAIAGWRRERGVQDEFGFGPEVARRHQRSAAGLDAMAMYVAGLDDEDARLVQLENLAFQDGFFDPGATLLNELGRFRFHDPTTTCEAFLEQMIEFAGRDRSEAQFLGGQQVDGDNPWRAEFEIRMPGERDI